MNLRSCKLYAEKACCLKLLVVGFVKFSLLEPVYNAGVSVFPRLSAIFKPNPEESVKIQSIKKHVI